MPFGGRGPASLSSIAAQGAFGSAAPFLESCLSLQPPPESTAYPFPFPVYQRPFRWSPWEISIYSQRTMPSDVPLVRLGSTVELGPMAVGGALPLLSLQVTVAGTPALPP